MNNTSDASRIYHESSSAPASSSSTADSRGTSHETSADASGVRDVRMLNTADQEALKV